MEEQKIERDNIEKDLSFPTEVIDLPSKGLVYPKSSPLSTGQITIKYMTAKEEDILASQNLIKKGVVLDKLFESIVVDPDVNIDDIILGDKTAILLATRMLGYGKTYTIEVTDPFTLEKQNETIDLSAVKLKEIDENILNRDNRYSFTLPQSGKEVEFKFLTHGDEIEINKEIQALQKIAKKTGSQFTDKDVTTRLRHTITAIDGEYDRGYINKYINHSILALDSRALREYYKKIAPDMDLTFEFTSNLTGESEVLNIPFGINFFYPSE